MEVLPLQPFGAEVRHLPLRQIDLDGATQLRDVVIDNGVVVLPEQPLNDDEFVRFLRLLGPPAFTAGETPLPGHPDLNAVSNVGRTRPPRSSFHTDTSYVRRPPAFTALRAVDVPAAGGATLFTDQRRACDTLPPEDRQLLAGRTLRHVATGVDLGPDEETAADHPVLRAHPVSGRTVLFLTAAARCVSISGLDGPTTEATIERLLAHSTAPEGILRHRWSAGDVVVWDNGSVLHRADHDGVVGDRVLHRGMVATYGNEASRVATYG